MAKLTSCIKLLSILSLALVTATWVYHGYALSAYQALYPLSGFVIDAETMGRIDGALVRAYARTGELLAEGRTDSLGYWSLQLDAVRNYPVVLQAGFEGYFIRTVTNYNQDSNMTIALVSDDEPALWSLLEKMAYSKADGTRLSRFSPKADARIAVLAENPITGSIFERWQLDAMIGVLADCQEDIEGITGGNLSKVEVLSPGEGEEFNVGSIWVLPERPMPGLGHCTWLYDDEYNVVAAIIQINASIPTPEMLRHVLLHELMHIIFPADVLIIKSIISEVFMFFDYTELDKKASKIINNPFFLEQGPLGPTDRLDRLEMILGKEWGIIDKPWISGAAIY